MEKRRLAVSNPFPPFPPIAMYEWNQMHYSWLAKPPLLRLSKLDLPHLLRRHELLRWKHDFLIFFFLSTFFFLKIVSYKLSSNVEKPQEEIIGFKLRSWLGECCIVSWWSHLTKLKLFLPQCSSQFFAIMFWGLRDLEQIAFIGHRIFFFFKKHKTYRKNLRIRFCQALLIA